CIIIFIVIYLSIPSNGCSEALDHS
ncbi:hypothetical protein MTP99_013163, partial [Tenebrio molitor]